MKDHLKSAFYTYTIFTIVGAFMKLYHIYFSQVVMLTGIVTMVIFIILALVEIYKSIKIDGTEKFMWTIGMLLFYFFAGIAYLVWGRKRIVTN